MGTQNNKFEMKPTAGGYELHSGTDFTLDGMGREFGIGLNIRFRSQITEMNEKNYILENTTSLKHV